MSDCSEDNDGDFQPCGINVKSLPAVMQGRVKALKNLQMDTVKVGLGRREFLLWIRIFKMQCA